MNELILLTSKLLALCLKVVNFINKGVLVLFLLSDCLVVDLMRYLKQLFLQVFTMELGLIEHGLTLFEVLFKVIEDGELLVETNESIFEMFNLVKEAFIFKLNVF